MIAQEVADKAAEDEIENIEKNEESELNRDEKRSNAQRRRRKWIICGKGSAATSLLSEKTEKPKEEKKDHSY